MEKKEKSLKILAIQMSSTIGDVKANYAKVEALIGQNITDEVDVVVLPEVWTVGWSCKNFKANAEILENSETINFLSNIAKKYNVNIIGGSIISKQETGNSKKNNISSQLTAHSSLYNTCPVINRKGELVAFYDKMHLFSYYGCDENSYIQSGLKPVMVQIDGFKIGLSLCYDIRFPELYRTYAKAGADVLINMAAWPLSRAVHWESLTKARAIENQCYMVAVTQSGLIENEEWNLGHSRIISYDGNILGEIGVGDSRESSVEGAFISEIKLDEMYEFRKKCTVLLDIHEDYEI